ncbi:MAG: GNAT family N-acetyltransferase [Bacteroidota bacterium]|nr:GNAT family N-acetyltransferase [Bacteroidota bacterium]
MIVEFKKVSEFKRGILFELLKDAYSFDCRYEHRWSVDWQAFDNFFFDNLNIADKYGFVTTLHDEAIGFVSWDPRNMPEYVEIGYNCIASKYKGKGYGKLQLQEAVNRIIQSDLKKIIVTTNEKLVAAQRMYENVGFVVTQRRPNQNSAHFAGEYIDYVFML